MRTSFEIDPSQWPELWRAAYQILEQTIPSNQLRAWIQPLTLSETVSDADGGSIRIRFVAHNKFSADWARDKHQKAIEAAFAQVTGTPCAVEFSYNEESYAHPVPAVVENPSRASAASPPPTSPSAPSAAGVVIRPGNRQSFENSLDPRFTFESYVVGTSNQFARAAAVAVSEQPARQYNPLFLYSQPGLGKTHLLHAIGNHVLAKFPQMRVAYLSAESYMNEFIDSIAHNRTSQFRTKYRDTFDLILIDDIQFIAGKQKTEEEFFHTFNALHGSKRQIVLTSDRPPKEIEGLEERIRTRFEMGLVADILPPEIETRIAILKAKAERDDIYLPDDVATFLATHIRSNVRELEGILVRLQAHASLTGAEISLEMARHELKMTIPEESSHLTVEAIQAAVAKHFHLKPADLKATTRAQTIAFPRQIAMFLIRKYTSMGFKEIGQYFGGKDHTTTLHAYQKIEKGVENDPEIREAVEAIQGLL